MALCLSNIKRIAIYFENINTKSLINYWIAT